jgi:hypothetical protein
MGNMRGLLLFVWGAQAASLQHSAAVPNANFGKFRIESFNVFSG